ncbi:MAG: hypothetical protein PHH37_10545 [Paludibacter sp.]|nr:hypothetical protein [Paludibacter sp.]
MAKIKIQLKGIGAELVLGNYMPTDSTIMNDWQEFYHYNDLIHESQLIVDYISEILVEVDEKQIFKGHIPAKAFIAQKSFTPVLVDRALYLRTECAEETTYTAEFECEQFDLNKLTFETQEYDLFFKVGKSFLAKMLYDNSEIPLEWTQGKALGNICLLCRFEKGYLIPIYDAVHKVEAKK